MDRRYIRSFRNAYHTAMNTLASKPARSLSGKVYFMHIGKAGGTSVNSFVSSNFPAGRSLFHIESKLQKVSPEELREDYDFISGHLGVQRVKKLINLEEYTRFTLLRNPEHRFVSNLNWVKHIGSKPTSKFFLNHTPKIQELSLRLNSFEFSNLDALSQLLSEEDPTFLALFDNIQTKYFLAKPRAQSLTASDFERAKTSLQEDFDLFGTVERLDVLLDSLCECFGWTKSEQPPKENALSNKFGFPFESEAALELIKPFCEWDQKLYHYATESLDA